MVEYWKLDYGHKVKVLSGKNEGKTGWIVYGSDRGYICINTHKIPKDNSYQISEFPENLEILSMDNPHKIKHLFGGLSNFDFVKLEILIEKPEIILMKRQYFDEKTIQLAKRGLVSKVAIEEICKNRNLD